MNIPEENEYSRRKCGSLQEAFIQKYAQCHTIERRGQNKK
jgi:hypothetical protein